MDVYIADDPSLAAEGRQALKTHLQDCPQCSQEYEENRLIIRLVKECWHGAENNRLFARQTEQPAKPWMTVDEGWEDLKCRIPELSKIQGRRKQPWLFRWVGATAACLAVGVFSWIVILTLMRPKVDQQPVPSPTFVSEAALEIELLTDKGKVIVPVGTEVKTAAMEQKTLTIDHKHSIIMNSGAVLSVRRLSEEGLAGCLVHLYSGEILAHVEPDGNPFVIATKYGNVTVTGTILDVETTENSTTLVVSQGSARFESSEGGVEVAAGHISRILGRTVPTEPVSCNAGAMTAWAAERQKSTGFAKGRLNAKTRDDNIDPWVAATVPSIDLEAIDIDDWMEKKQDWFEQEFPWIFRLKNALAEESVQAGYQELLTQSGDLWQFAYPETVSDRIAILEPNSLRRAASEYGLSEQWLVRNVPTVECAIDSLRPQRGRAVGLEAFKKWAACFENARRSSTQLDQKTLSYSLHACNYLVNTRVIAWFGVSRGQLAFRPENKNTVADLLESEVNTARDLSTMVVRLWALESNACIIYTQWLEEIIDRINTLADIEKGIREHEIRK
jgi:ferric-dicitrate binding protein FerR (iron transport regulator)